MRYFKSAFSDHKIAIDMEWIIAYQAQEHCEGVDRRPVTGIFIQGFSFTIDMPFDEFDKIFKESRSV